MALHHTKTQMAEPVATTPELPIYTNVDKVPLPLLEQMSGHWLAMYLNQKRQHDVSAKHIIWSQLLTILFVGWSGVYLQHNSRALFLLGGALIVYPAVSGLLSSNATGLSASLHHEMADYAKLSGRVFMMLLHGLGQALAVSLFAGAILSLFSGALGVLFFQAGLLPTVRLAFLVTIATAGVGLPIVVGLMLLIRRVHSNPDDVAGPTANTIFSFLPLVFIVIFSKVLS